MANCADAAIGAFARVGEVKRVDKKGDPFVTERDQTRHTILPRAAAIRGDGICRKSVIDPICHGKRDIAITGFFNSVLMSAIRDDDHIRNLARQYKAEPLRFALRIFIGVRQNQAVTMLQRMIFKRSRDVHKEPVLEVRQHESNGSRAAAA